MDEPKASSKALAKIEDTDAPSASLTSLSFPQIKSVAQVLAASGMFQDIAKDSAKAFVKILAGQEMGIAPFQAMSDIHIIQGKATAGGNIFAGKVKAHPKYDYRVRKWDETSCSIEFLERVSGKLEPIGTSTFTQEDARRAGLLSNPSWSKYPRNMYFNRAMTNGVRTFCPDALGGIAAYTPEELQDGRDYIEVESATMPTQDADPVDPGLLEEAEALDEQFKDAVHEPTDAEMAGEIDLPDEPKTGKK
jgi:hypothetical protein